MLPTPKKLTVFSVDGDGCYGATVYRSHMCSQQELSTTLHFNALNIMSLCNDKYGSMSSLRNFYSALHDRLSAACKQGDVVVMSGSARQSPLADLENMDKRGGGSKLVQASSSMFFELDRSIDKLKSSKFEAATLSYDPISLYEACFCKNQQEKDDYHKLCQEYGQAVHAELKDAAQTAVDKFVTKYPQHKSLQELEHTKEKMITLTTKLSNAEKDELSNAFLDSYQGDASAEAYMMHYEKALRPNENKYDIIYFQIQRMAEKYPNTEIEFNFIDDRGDILEAIHSFYSEQPHLIPKNVTLNLYRYKDSTHDEPIRAKEKDPKKNNPDPDVDEYTGKDIEPITGTGEFNPSYMSVLRKIFEKQPDQYHSLDFQIAAQNTLSLQQTAASAPNNSQKSENTGVSASTAPLPPLVANNSFTFFKAPPAATHAPAPDNIPPKPKA